MNGDKKTGSSVDDVIHVRAAGIDISKSDAKVCVRILPPGKRRVTTETKVFGSSMAEIRRLRAWLIESQVSCVVMESTSAYWKPFWDGLQDAGFEVLLANAQAVKQARGRKTDMADAAWLAKLAALGMVAGSFVPTREVRDLRLATRARTRLVQRVTSITASLEKLLEDTGSKLSAASSKLLTKSGRAILEAICDGVTDPAELAKLSKLRKVKGQALVDALELNLRPVHVPLIRTYLKLIDQGNTEIEQVEKRIAELAAPFRAEIDLLCTMPGISDTLATAIIGEIGVDMTAFPTGRDLAAWAGLAPGANESAGRTRPIKCRKGDKYLKAAMSQAARSAVNTDGCFFQARFRRVRARRGEAKAYTAVARSMTTAIWAMLLHHEEYHETGGDYYVRTATNAQRARMQANAEATLTRLGVEYTIHKPAVYTPAT